MTARGTDELPRAWPGSLALLRPLTDWVGPAAVMAAGTMGAGAMASFLLTGAWFGYDLLWVILLMLPVFVVSADCASRIGALNPHTGIFSLVRRHISGVLAWSILLVVVPVHFLVSMGQISVMASAATKLFSSSTAPGDAMALQMALALGLSVGTLWLVLSRGYARMQRVMSALMVLMFLCFLIVAARGLTQWPEILAGLIPSIPADLPVAGSETGRAATTSILAMVGAAIAPAALLGLPYLCADDGAGHRDLARGFRQAIVNLGVVFGAYAMLVLIAGGYALHRLPEHASFSDISQAAEVFRQALPGVFAPLGPAVFSLGLLVAAMTTLVVAAQVTIYFVLDMLGRRWRFEADNRPYHIALSIFILAAAALAPLWDFPALLKVILLMGVNVVVIPVVYLVLLILSNSRSAMHGLRTSWWRNLMLVIGLGASLVLAAGKLPGYIALLAG